jgi:two-component system KDP operon response regulator KdpE
VKGQPRILVVDDEAGIRKFLRVSLQAHGYDVKETACGIEALEAAQQYRPDLVVLDLGLPDISGLEVISSLREWSTAPVLVLSVMDSEPHKVQALDAGADDYLTKPFGLKELLARVRAALRRSFQLPADDPVFRFDGLVVDLGLRCVLSQEREVQLTPTEFDLLRHFVLNAGKVLTHRQLLSKVWGPDYGDETHLLRVNISNLRRKIEPDPVRPRYLVTEAGVGYRLRNG